jgi:branched-chain amino acid transport system permease protein
VNVQFWLIQAFNGISYGALLFLLGSGLSLIFGVMRIVNLSHGSYFLLGGYMALSVIWSTGSWLLAIPVAAVSIGLLGLVMERVFLRPLGCGRCCSQSGSHSCFSRPHLISGPAIPSTSRRRMK